MHGGAGAGTGVYLAMHSTGSDPWLIYRRLLRGFEGEGIGAGDKLFRKRRIRMVMHEILHLLIWCTVINYAILILWFGVFVWAHDWLYRVHSRWFKVPVETFGLDTLWRDRGLQDRHFAVYLVPLIAVHFI